MRRRSRALVAAATLAILVATFRWASAQQSPAPASSSSSQRSSAEESSALPEVTVIARRAQLAPRVRAFVSEISVPDLQGTGLARWYRPVCPLVSGLPRRDGEFVLERLSEIARAASVALGREQCRPNLYILVTAQPEELLRGMEKRNRGFTFGRDFFSGTGAPPSVVDAFINAPRAVRVWYNSDPENPDNATPGLGYPGNIADLSGGGDLPAPAISEWELSSHLARSLIRTFSRVFVIVDRTRLQRVTFGQLADYVAMVGLAQIKPTPDLRDAPTILRLFEGMPQSAPPGMSAWDRAFLKGLYTTAQSSKIQRALIARSMVSEIVPQ